MPERPGARLLLVLGVLYFAQGLPAGMLARSLPAIGRDLGLPREYIGLLALPALPWVLKFLWAPWVDRFGSGRPDHRKRWVLAAQLNAVLLLLGIGLLDPGWLFGPGLWALLGLLFLLNLCFATHDIASDGLAVRLLPERWRGPGNTLQTGGYKLGMIVGGAGLLLLGGVLGWTATFSLAAAGLLALLIPVWRFSEPAEAAVARPRASAAWWLREFIGFWRRPGMGLWLVLLLGYRIGDSLGSRMIKPWLVDEGWSLEVIGVVDLVASVAGLVGAFLGGLSLLRLPRIHALVVFGLLQAGGLLGWAMIPPDRGWVLAVAVFEYFADGLSTVVLFTMMMDRCRAGHEGVDYTMQACLVLGSSGVFTLLSGLSANVFGYETHFVLSAGLAALAIMPAVLWKRAVHD